MENKRRKILTVFIDVVLHVVVFLFGLGSYLMWDSGTGGTTQGHIFNALFAWIGFLMGGAIVLAVLIASLFLRKDHWYIVTVTLAATLLFGVLVGLLQDIVFITPREYGERGAAWASGRYGSWRVLK